MFAIHCHWKHQPGMAGIDFETSVYPKRTSFSFSPKNRYGGRKFYFLQWVFHQSTLRWLQFAQEMYTSRLPLKKTTSYLWYWFCNVRLSKKDLSRLHSKIDMEGENFIFRSDFFTNLLCDGYNSLRRCIRVDWHWKHLLGIAGIDFETSTYRKMDPFSFSLEIYIY